MEEKIRLKITLTEKDIKDYVYGQTLKSARGIAFFALGVIAIVILAGLREKMEYNDIPAPFKGMPLVLLTSGLMAIAFTGFSALK